MNTYLTGAALVLSVGAVASATPVLQFDVNSFSAQAVNAGGSSIPFGGLTHTGGVKFSLGGGSLGGIFIQSVANGSFTNAGFSGFTLTGFSGQVNLNAGAVTGGTFTITINNGDAYTCNIAPGSGAVSTFVGGGFKIEGLTRNGLFTDSVFGNVNVAPWFNTQGLGNGLLGSFLQFNFSPDANGLASSDMDCFVDVVPVPPGAWAGLATMGGMLAARRLRRR